VVGTDGSETAERAVEHAAGLAATLDATLVVVTAYRSQPDQEITGPPSRVPGELEWAATASAGAEEVAGRAARAAARVGASSVRVRTQAGDAATVLGEVSDEVGAGLVVVGSRGMSSATRFVVGSVANSLSHRADRDVLIVSTE
jgi:nucleotide-binding universal stress UspA family protein